VADSIEPPIKIPIGNVTEIDLEQSSRLESGFTYDVVAVAINAVGQSPRSMARQYFKRASSSKQQL